MANQSIYNAFERMWTHTLSNLDRKAESFIVNITEESDGSYTADKTFNEINEAANARKIMYALVSGVITFNFIGYSTSTYQFMFGSIWPQGGTKILLIGADNSVMLGDGGVTPVNQGGTGSNTAAGALTNLGLTATASELNTLDGITATTTELNYCDGVTSNIQTQLNGKLPLTGGTITGLLTVNGDTSLRFPIGAGSATAAPYVVLRKAGNSGSYTLSLVYYNADGNATFNNLINADGSRNWALNNHNHDSVYLKLTGGTLSGSISVVRSDATVAQFHAKNSLRQGSLYVSEVGNLGIYDRTNSKWVIRSDTNQNIYFGQQIAGTIWGPGVSSAWNKGRDNAKFRVTSQTGYTPALSIKTTTGSWEIGTYGSSNLSSSVGDSVNGTKNWLLFNFVPDYNYTNSVNTVQSRIAFTDYGDLYIQWLNIGNNTATGNLAQITEDAIYTQQDTYEIIPPADNAGVIVGKTIFGPCITKNYNLGNSNYRWKQLYATTTTINTSDRNLKKDFRTFDSDDRYTQFFMDLKPMIFKMKDGESGRDHFGFIAQDVEDSLLSLGYTSLDFAGLCKDAKCIEQKKPTKEEIRNKKFKFQEEPPLDLDENGNIQYEYSLRYQEFISLNTYMIQKNVNEINLLKEENQLLKQELQEIKNLLNGKL